MHNAAGGDGTLSQFHDSMDTEILIFSDDGRKDFSARTALATGIFFFFCICFFRDIKTKLFDIFTEVHADLVKNKTTKKKKIQHDLAPGDKWGATCLQKCKFLLYV